MSYSGTILARNPLHYFRLGELAGTVAVDEMANTTGTYVGSPTFQEEEPLGVGDGNGCVYLAATDWINAPHSDVLNGITHLTVEAWFKLNSWAATAPPYQNAIVNKWGPASHYDDWFAAWVDNNTHKVGWATADGTGNNKTIYSTSTIDLNTWYYLICTFNSGEMKIYIDGLQKGYDTASYTNFNQGLGAAHLQIGGHHHLVLRPFDGWIDEVAIYNSPWPYTVDFYGTPLQGAAPLAVDFYMTQAEAPSSITWTFGDGYTSTDTDPIHTYLYPGVYTVSVDATVGEVDYSLVKSGYVSVTAGGTSPPSGIAKGIYQLVLSNKNRYPYKIGYDTMISKVDILQNRRMSFLQDTNVDLWLNYNGSWTVYESGLTNREGSVYLNHSGMTRSGISNCLGIARATINDQDYISNIIRYNFV